MQKKNRRLEGWARVSDRELSRYQMPPGRSWKPKAAVRCYCFFQLYNQQFSAEFS